MAFLLLQDFLQLSLIELPPAREVKTDRIDSISFLIESPIAFFAIISNFIINLTILTILTVCNQEKLFVFHNLFVLFFFKEV